jgi:hypothetical protein
VTTGSLNSLSYAPATSQQVPAAESFLAPADSMGLSNERLPLTKSTRSQVEAPPLRTLTATASVPVSDTLTKSTQPLENSFGRTGMPAGDLPERQDIPELEQSLPEPEDLSDVIAQTDIELARLRWSPEAGRDYLLSNYGKRSRKLLTQKELLEFLKYLKSQPTPRKPN